MSGVSSNAAAWFTRLEQPHRFENVFQRADDPRLGEVIETWAGDLAALRAGRAVLIGFPQEEGVRRNHGRGAAEAPHEIRRWLYRMTTHGFEKDADLVESPPLDAGNVRLEGTLEDTQRVLAEVMSGVLTAGAIPVVLGGGHETAYGNYLGYVAAEERVGIINLDAHLDIRPCLADLGHSGSPFRQALEHPTHPLPGPHYVCLGAQPFSTSRQHEEYARERGCIIRWADEVSSRLTEHFKKELNRLEALDCQVYVSLDADVVQAADVPGVSAPNPVGLAGREVLACVRLAGRSPAVSSFDLVEICPPHDQDGQSTRWAALAVWHFLMGAASR